jgi:hypothetical protein
MPRRRNRNRRKPIQVGNHSIDPAKLIPDPMFRPMDVNDPNQLTGWRAWQVDKQLPAFGLAPKLGSVSHTYWWTPKRKAEADCDLCGDPDNPNAEGVPGVDCGCGFYSAKSLKHLMQLGYHTYGDIDEIKQFKIIGQVAVWGKVIEGTQGWRSQYAYPRFLMLPYEMGFEFGHRIKDAYGCQVRLLNFLKQPHEITDEAIADLLSPTPTLTLPERRASKGRRLEHRQLKFAGHAVSDSYVKNGRKLIDVVWDVSPDKNAVPTLIENIKFES